MAESFIGNVLEFAVGFLLIGALVGLIELAIILFVLPFFNIQPSLQLVLISGYVLRGITLLLLFCFRKSIALGYLLGLVLEFITTETLFSYFGKLTTH